MNVICNLLSKAEVLKYSEKYKDNEYYSYVRKISEV